MKSKTTLILLAVAVALGLWVKFYESKGPNTEEAKRRSGNVVNFERDQLDGILIYHNAFCMSEAKKISAIKPKSDLPLLPSDSEPLTAREQFWRRLRNRFRAHIAG